MFVAGRATGGVVRTMRRDQILKARKVNYSVAHQTSRLVAVRNPAIGELNESTRERSLVGNSEYDTVLLSDFVEHIPRSVLAKNFNVQQSALDALPKQPLYIFQSKIPQTSLEEARRQAAGGVGLSPETFTCHMSGMSPTHKNEFGEARIVDRRNFKVNNAVALAHVTVHPGGMRELHWHQNADEWQYYVAGKARMTVFAAGQRARTMDFQKGDVGYIKQTFPHYIENTGTEDLVYIELFKDNFFQDVSLTNWLTHLPPALVQGHLNISAATLQAIPHSEMVTVGYPR